MPHPSQFKRAGGKKGPRQATSKRQPKISLRPAPARSTRPQPRDDHLDEGGDNGHEEEEEEEGNKYGYREALQQEVKPLVGLKISVSGCSGTKEDLLALAEEYGAERHGGLSEDTTHLVTDSPSGAKYNVALSRRMHIMFPTWLNAVREAWLEGGEVDWEELEQEHEMPPLYGVVACTTHFAHGDYKDSFKSLLLQAGASLTAKLDTSVTHLIVASPSSPHSPTASSDKLLHARKNLGRLKPGFRVVWEGWAREAVKYGGRRDNRDRAWEYNDSAREPVEDLAWAVATVPPRSGHVARPAHAEVLARPDSAPLTPVDHLAPPSRSLVSAGVPGVATKPTFKGYDASLDFSAEGSTSAASKPAFDTSNGKVVKKRRRVAGTNSFVAPSTSQQHVDDPSLLLEAYGASQQQPGNGSSRFADADTDVTLPSIDAVLAALRSKQPSGAKGEGEEGGEAEMALELVPGEVELQYTTKSKSVIKALASIRKDSFVPDDDDAAGNGSGGSGGGNKRKPTQCAPAAFRRGGNVDADDSGYLEAVPAFSDAAPAAAAEETGETQLGETLPANIDQPNSSPPSSEEEPPKQIFEGKTFAVEGLKGATQDGVKAAIEVRGGRVVGKDGEQALKGVEWVIVEFVASSAHRADYFDPHLVTVCWLELCIFCDRFLEPSDRLLERPLPYACPVDGLEELKLHFSGFGPEEEPIMHHNRRFAGLIGATASPTFDRSITHLIVAALDANPSFTADDLNEADHPKVKLARKWGTPICSLKWLREKVAERAKDLEVEEAEKAAAQKKGKEVKDKGKGKMRERSVREITNELDERQTEEESYRGPLSDCVVYFSPKIEIDRQRLASIVEDLGAVAARSYSASVTHFVHFCTKATGSFKDFKLAKNDGAFIVHPRWVEECGHISSRASEGDFPHTFDSRKGGQLFDAGISVNPAGSPPRDSSSSSRQPFGGQSSPAGGPLARSPSKLSLGKASPSPRPSPGAERARPKKRALELEEEEQGDAKRTDLPSPSPSPRRRRSDTTVTEVADETTVDMGGFDGQAFDSPDPVPRASAPHATSSSPFLPPQPGFHAALDSADNHPSSDIDPAPLQSERRASVGSGSGAGSTQLRQQTSLLMQQLLDAPQAEKMGRSKSKNGLMRKKSSGSGTTSLSSTRNSPLAADPAPASDSTSFPPPPRRMPGMGYNFEPTQATQDDESIYVQYDNPAEQAARERIQRALAAGGGGGGGAAAGGAAGTTQDGEDGAPTRTRRSTRVAAGRR